MRPVTISVADPATLLLTGAGSPVSLHSTLTTLITRSLGAQHAALLAQPVAGVDGQINWYTELHGEIASPSDMSLATRSELCLRADALLADIRRLQTRLNAEGPASRATARLLMQAFEVDLDTCLHSVGGQPVLAPWGAKACHVVAPATAASVRETPSIIEPALQAATGFAGPALAAATSPAPNLIPGRRVGLHAVASLLLLLIGGGALLAALDARQSANPAEAAEIDALTSSNAQLRIAVRGARNGKCR